MLRLVGDEVPAESNPEVAAEAPTRPAPTEDALVHALLERDEARMAAQHNETLRNQAERQWRESEAARREDQGRLRRLEAEAMESQRKVERLSGEIEQGLARLAAQEQVASGDLPDATHLLAEHKAMTLEVERRTAELSTLRTEAALVRESLAAEKIQAQQLRLDLGDARDALRDHVDVRAVLEAELGRWKEEHQRARDELLRREAEGQEQRTRIRELDLRVIALDRDLGRLRDEGESSIRRTREELEAVEAAHQAASEARALAQEAEIERLRRAESEAQRERLRLVEEAQRLGADVARLEAFAQARGLEAEEGRGRLTVLERELADAREGSLASAARAQELLGQLARHREDTLAARTKVMEIEAQLGRQAETASRAVTRATELEARLSKHLDEIERARTAHLELEQLQQRIGELEAMLTSLTPSGSEAEGEPELKVKAALQQVEELHRALRLERRVGLDLRRTLDEAETQGETIARREEEARRLTESAQLELEEQRELQRHSEATAAQRLQEAEARGDSLASTIAELEGRIRAQHGRQGSLEEQLSRTATQLEVARAALVVVEQQHRADLDRVRSLEESEARAQADRVLADEQARRADQQVRAEAQRAQQVELRAAAADARVRDAEQRAQHGESRAREADRRASEALTRAQEAEQHQAEVAGRLARFEQLVVAREKDLDEAVEIRRRAEERLTDAEGARRDAEDRAADRQRRLVDAEGRLAEAENKVHEYAEKLLITEVELRDAAQGRVAEQARADAVVTDLGALTLRSESIERELRAAEQRLLGERDDLAMRLTQAGAELTTRDEGLRSLEGTLRERDSQLVTQARDLDHLRHEIERERAAAAAEGGRSAARHEEASRQLEQQRHTIEDWQRQVSALHGELGAVQADLRTAQEGAGRLRAERDDERARAEAAERALHHLQESLERTANGAQQTAVEVATLRTEVDRSRTLAERLETEARRAEAAHHELEGRVHELRRQLVEAQSERDHALTQSEQRSRERLEAEHRAEELTQQLGAARLAGAAIADHGPALDELRNQLATARAERGNEHQLRQRLEQDLQAAHRSKAELEEALRLLREDHERESDLTSVSADPIHMDTTLQIAVSDLRRQLDGARDDASVAEHRATRAEAHARELEALVAQLQEGVTQLEAAVDRRDQQMDALRTRLVPQGGPPEEVAAKPAAAAPRQSMRVATAPASRVLLQQRRPMGPGSSGALPSVGPAPLGPPRVYAEPAAPRPVEDVRAAAGSSLPENRQEPSDPLPAEPANPSHGGRDIVSLGDIEPIEDSFGDHLGPAGEPAPSMRGPSPEGDPGARDPAPLAMGKAPPPRPVVGSRTGVAPLRPPGRFQQPPPAGFDNASGKLYSARNEPAPTKEQPGPQSGLFRWKR